jgi:CheY-specific phosphatase CheX
MTAKARNDAVLDGILCDATTAIFAHYGVALTPVGPSRAAIGEQDAVGVMGFTGDLVRGTLVIATSCALVNKSCPDSGGPPIPDRDRARDWVGELANLVLGRAKAGLGAHGVVMGLSTPVAIVGERLRVSAVHSRTRAWDFTSADGDVRAWLEADFAPGVELTIGPGPSAEPELAAGEPILF